MGVVAVDEAPSGGTPGVIQFVFKAQPRVGIAQAFVGVKVGRIKPGIDPQPTGIPLCTGGHAQAGQAGADQVAPDRESQAFHASGQRVLNTPAATRTVSAMSASVWAALTKPASYKAGAM